MAKLKLYLDEDLSPVLAKALRSKGFDVISSHETGMNGKSDEEQLKYATSQQRAILSFNVGDYAILAKSFYQEKHDHFGIIVSRKIELKELIRCALNLLRKVQQKEMKNRFEWLQNYKGGGIDAT
ncbi:MAG: DUF5615 family PIN-like protein [bacterium]|nr:DUF5615 family PIN-like protein [bacterium]